MNILLLFLILEHWSSPCIAQICVLLDLSSNMLSGTNLLLCCRLVNSSMSRIMCRHFRFTKSFFNSTVVSSPCSSLYRTNKSYTFFAFPTHGKSCQITFKCPNVPSSSNLVTMISFKARGTRTAEPLCKSETAYTQIRNKLYSQFQ